MIALALLAAGASPDLQQTQRKLDFMVGACRADGIVRAIAHDPRHVSVALNVPVGLLPSVTQNQAFQCVLAKAKQRPELELVAADPQNAVSGGQKK